jgi:hypothetical protein
LAHPELARVARKMKTQIGFKPDQVKLFTGSNRRRVIEEVAHWRPP